MSRLLIGTHNLEITKFKFLTSQPKLLQQKSVFIDS